MGVALVAGVGAGGAGAAAEPGASESAHAVQTVKKSVWGPTTLNGRSLFPTYQALGVGLYSIQARWDQIAPSDRPRDPKNPNDPAYEWPAHLDAAVSEATDHGMKVQMMLMGTPPWANESQTWRWVPNDPSDFGNFATAIARRYPNVHLWMIWGEPNRKHNFQPFTPAKTTDGKLNRAQRVAPHNYAVLLDIAYEALKAESRANLVIGGNTYTASGPADINTYPWIRHMKLPDGSRPRMDMYGHNPWGASIPNLNDAPSPRGSVAFGDLRRLAVALDKAYPRKRLKLFLAEWGVPTGFRDEDLMYELKPNEAKRWVKAAFKIARAWKRIYTIGWVHPVDTERNSMGLLDSSGNRKPTYDAFQAG